MEKSDEKCPQYGQIKELEQGIRLTGKWEIQKGDKKGFIKNFANLENSFKSTRRLKD